MPLNYNQMIDLYNGDQRLMSQLSITEELVEQVITGDSVNEHIARFIAYFDTFVREFDIISEYSSMHNILTNDIIQPAYQDWKNTAQAQELRNRIITLFSPGMPVRFTSYQFPANFTQLVTDFGGTEGIFR